MERQKSRPGAADIYVPPEEHWPVNLVSVSYRKMLLRNIWGVNQCHNRRIRTDISLESSDN